MQHLEYGFALSTVAVIFQILPLRLATIWDCHHRLWVQYCKFIMFSNLVMSPATLWVWLQSPPN